ncbi:unnamed protein product [Rotaria socialis]|uniref:Uncharacterized protein n=2 Tax=Rotaria socialis TaxID=392032 RepID=A0A821KEY8_9BILA|nr:unnamed protein product [Rotaria socialis]
MNLDRILYDMCTYIFLELKCSVYIRKLKKEIRLQISRIVQSARVRAAGKSVIHILLQSIGEFIQYQNKDNSSPILLIRKTNDETDVFQFYPWLNMVEITFNDMFVKKT